MGINFAAKMNIHLWKEDNKLYSEQMDCNYISECSNEDVIQPEFDECMPIYEDIVGRLKKCYESLEDEIFVCVYVSGEITYYQHWEGDWDSKSEIAFIKFWEVPEEPIEELIKFS